MSYKKFILFLLFVFLLLPQNSLFAENWPTFKHDVYRTGISTEKVKLPLYLQWAYIMRQPPVAAWGKAGVNINFKFDWASEIIAVDGRIYFGSTTDDKVYCLDAVTGREIWAFYTEGPVRFAPMVTGDKLVFGSDDGAVYCLDKLNGTLLWKYNPRPNAFRIGGNGRIISNWPIRTDVLVVNEAAYFYTGLLSGQSFVSVNVSNGLERSDEVSWGYNFQGYLQAQVSGEILPMPPIYSMTENGDDSSLYRITVDSVDFRVSDGLISGYSGSKKVWDAQVKGKPRSLAFSNGSLFASTDSGYIYCFAGTSIVPATITPPVPKPYPFFGEETAYRNAAAAIAATSGHGKGYALVLESNGGRLAYTLASITELNIICVESDSAKASQTRKDLDSAGLYGRVSVINFVNSKLPFKDMLFNIVTYDGYANGSPFYGARDEALRVLRPYGGTAYLGADDVFKKGPIKDAGEWSHHYCRPDNNPDSDDPYVSGGMSVQWFGQPGPEHSPDRLSRALAPLWKNGILVVPGEEYLTAVDGYNGTILWKKNVSQFLRLPGPRHCGYSALDSDYLYVASGNQCLAMVPQTGEKQRTFDIPSALAGPSVVWGLVAFSGDLLFGSTIHSYRCYRTSSSGINGESPGGIGWDGSVATYSVEDALFAYNRHQNQDTPLWIYRPDSGRIVSTTITIAQNTVYFLESINSDIQNTNSCLFELNELVKNDTLGLVALNAFTGTTIWRKMLYVKAYNRLAMMYANSRLIINGYYNGYSAIAGDSLSRYMGQFLSSIDAATGQTNWTRLSPTNFDNGGYAIDYHALVQGDTIFTSPNTGYCLSSGEFINTQRYGVRCGSPTGAHDVQFPKTIYDASCSDCGFYTAMRPSCYMNSIPAGGLLSMTEASNGCWCKPIQASVALLSTNPGINTSITSMQVRLNVMDKLSLSAFPNPFNPIVTIEYAVPAQKTAGDYSLRVFDCQGRLITTLVKGKAADQKAGPVRIVWTGLSREGKKVGSGIYICRLAYGDQTLERSMILLK